VLMLKRDFCVCIVSASRWKLGYTAGLELRQLITDQLACSAAHW